MSADPTPAFAAINSVADLDSLSPAEVEARYRPFLVSKGEDWVGQLELDLVSELSAAQMKPIRVAILYGSLRTR